MDREFVSIKTKINFQFRIPHQIASDPREMSDKVVLQGKVDSEELKVTDGKFLKKQFRLG